MYAHVCEGDGFGFVLGVKGGCGCEHGGCSVDVELTRAEEAQEVLISKVLGRRRGLGFERCQRCVWREHSVRGYQQARAFTSFLSVVEVSNETRGDGSA